MDGFCKWPRLEVVCLGSWPNTIMFGLINLKASITTLPKRIKSNHQLNLGAKSKKNIIITFNTLNGINYNSNSSLRQGLKTLLSVNIHTRQPAAKPRMRVVPADNHFWSASLPKHIQHFGLENWIYSFHTDTLIFKVYIGYNSFLQKVFTF